MKPAAGLSYFTVFAFFLVLLGGSTSCHKNNTSTPAPVHVPGPRQRVVLMGNSITQGWINLDFPFFRDNYHELINVGVTGETSTQMQRRFNTSVLDQKPACVVILAGINDIAAVAAPYDPDLTYKNIQKMAIIAKDSGIKVVLCSVLPAGDIPWHPGQNPMPKIQALNQRIKDYAKLRGHTYIDYYSVMVDGNSGMKAGLSIDGVHPNLAGYKVMEPVLMKTLMSIL